MHEDEDTTQLWEKLEKFGTKTDKTVDNLVKKVWFVEKIINASWVGEILNLSFIESANKRVKEKLKTICKIFWWLWLVFGGIFTIYSVYMFIKWIVHIFHWSIWLFLLSLILLVLSAFILIMSRWWLKMKKRVPALSIICVVIYLAIMIVSIFSAKIPFGIYLLCVLLSIVVTIFVLKNKDMFKD